MFELIFFLIILIYSVDSEINSSADLNCNFAVDCLWRNGTNGVEDSGEFAPGTSLQMDDYHKVTALRSDRDDPFIYSSAFGGRQTALLVSDVVSCQLGGASLKYWYWKTGTDAKLDICIRQPPGSRDPSTLKCYDGLASTHAQQWIYRSVEFPPISQPFELLFRATFTAPMDIIALDDINYDAILCVASNTGGTVSGGGPFGGAAGGSYSNDATDSWPAISQAPPSALSDGGDGSPPIFLPLSPTGSRKSPGLAAPTIAENIDPPSPPRSPFDDTHFGYSRASAAKTIGQIAPPVETQTNRVTGPRLGPAFQPRCPPIDCTFDQNIFCDYVTAVSDSDLIGVTEGAKEWRLARNRVENTLTGIAKDLSGRGGYVWAGGVNDPSDIFVLSSRTPLMMPAASRLDFFVHIAGIAGRLRVCFDTLQQCPFEISHRQIGVQARQWKNYFVTVPEGSHTIHFVADGLRKNYVVGLDHIQLLSKYGMSAQPC